jgi:hypothetical protein
MYRPREVEWVNRFLPSMSHAMQADADSVRLLWPKRGPHDKRRTDFVLVGSMDETFVCKIGGMMSAPQCAFKLEMKSLDPSEEECEYDKIVSSCDFKTLFYGFDCGTDNWLYPWLILDLDRFRALSKTPEYRIERGETWGDVRSGTEGYTRWIDLRRATKLDPKLIRDKSGLRSDAFPKRLARKIMDKTFFYGMKGPMPAYRVNEILAASTVLPNGAVLTPLKMSSYQFLRAVAERKGRL